MNQLQAFIGQEMFWEKTAIFGSKYQLVTSDEVLAMLDMDAWGRNATAQTAEGSVSIESRGFMNTSYHIHQADTELAVYTPSWGSSGTLQFADGRTFNWSGMGFLSGEYAWKDESDHPLMRFHSSVGGGKLYVVIEPVAGTMPELSLLAILGRYLQTLQQRKQRAAQNNIMRNNMNTTR
jgi:hypothetical protein